MADPDTGRSRVEVILRVRECPAVSESFTVDKSGKSVTLRQSVTNITDNTSKQELVTFQCDAALTNASQERTFEVVGRAPTDAVLAGYNGTVMCYGQTGAGKSFTMVGSRDSYHQRGIAARAIAHAFREAANRPADEFTFRFSCLEIYNDTMYDLLSTLPMEGERKELSLSEQRGKVEVKGLLKPEVDSEEAALQLLFEAESNRAVAQHQLNMLSSRSHVLYMLHVERRSKVASGAVVASRLTLVDLAGSERLKKSSGASEARPDPASARQLAKEAMSINKSLSFLEQVVVALGSRKGHVPHRSSKLTSVLRESLGGNCKTLLVANVWPEHRHMEETLSTLKFAARMQSVTNMAAINSQAEQSPAAALAECQRQMHDLKRELAMHDQLAGRGHISYDPYTPAQRGELKGRVRGYLEGGIEDLEASTLRQVKETFDIMRELYAEQAAALRAAQEAAASAQAAAASAKPASAGGFGGASFNAETEEVAGPVEVVDFVGEELGGGTSGFGCGVAPADARPPDPQFNQTPLNGGARGTSAVSNMRRSRDSLDFMQGSPSMAGGGPAVAPSMAGGDSAVARGGALFGGGRGASREDADKYFSEFKRGPGAEVASLLVENKTTLRERKAGVRQHAMAVNDAKRQIDYLKELVDAKKQGAGRQQVVNGEKAEVIDDEEFSLLAELKAAKGRYRAAYDALADERGQVDYINSTVENCRSQLLSDFSDAVNNGEVVDQDEKFEEMEVQLAMEKDPDSLPFFKASKLANVRSRKVLAGQDIHAKSRPFQ